LFKMKLNEENCTLLGCYAANSGNFLPMFRYNLSVTFTGFKNPKNTKNPFWILEPSGWDR